METYESSKPRANITTDTRFIDFTNSDFDSDILFRRMVRSKRNKHTSFETEPQISESSKTPHRSSSHEILSPSNTGQVENLLKLSSEDLNIDDVEMDEGVESLRNLLSVHQKIVFPTVRRTYPTLTLVRGTMATKKLSEKKLLESGIT